MSDNRRRMPSSAYLRAEMTEVNDTTTTARHSGQLLNQVWHLPIQCMLPLLATSSGLCDSTRNGAELCMGGVFDSSLKLWIYTAA